MSGLAILSRKRNEDWNAKEPMELMEILAILLVVKEMVIAKLA